MVCLDTHPLCCGSLLMPNDFYLASAVGHSWVHVCLSPGNWTRGREGGRRGEELAAVKLSSQYGMAKGLQKPPRPRTDIEIAHV